MPYLSVLFFHPLTIISIVTGFYLVLNILAPSTTFGGYGMILWSYHPVLMSIAFLLLMPIALVNQRIIYIHHNITNSSSSILPIRTFHKFFHAIIMGLSMLCILIGYYIAYDIHESKGKVHIPFHKGIIRTTHVLLGLGLLIIFLWQFMIGILQYFVSLKRIFLYNTLGRYLISFHTEYGQYFWYIGIGTYWLGLYIMFVQNTSSWGNFLICSILLLIQSWLTIRTISLYKQNHHDEYLRHILNLNFPSLLRVLIWDSNASRYNPVESSTFPSAQTTSTESVIPSQFDNNETNTKTSSDEDTSTMPTVPTLSNGNNRKKHVGTNN